jgi:hypothetical protein
MTPLKLALWPDLYLGEAYMNGSLVVERGENRELLEQLPNSLLWGVLAGTLNFIPYLGPAIMVVTLFVIGLLIFPTLKDAFVPPLIWIFVTLWRGNSLRPRSLDTATL